MKASRAPMNPAAAAISVVAKPACPRITGHVVKNSAAVPAAVAPYRVAAQNHVKNAQITKKGSTPARARARLCRYWFRAARIALPPAHMPNCGFHRMPSQKRPERDRHAGERGMHDGLERVSSVLEPFQATSSQVSLKIL